MSSAYQHKYSYYRCPDRVDCDFRKLINQEKLESWLLDNIEADFDVKVTQRPKQKRENPKKYKDRLNRLNEGSIRCVLGGSKRTLNGIRWIYLDQ